MPTENSIKTVDNSVRLTKTPPPAPARQNNAETPVVQAPTEAAKTAEAAELTKQGNSVELNHAVSDINNYVQSLHRELNFDIDHESGKVILQVVDSKTHEVIRQLPAEHALKLAQALHNSKQSIGNIFDGRA